jgi:hypothetical protein
MPCTGHERFTKLHYWVILLMHCLPPSHGRPEQQFHKNNNILSSFFTTALWLPHLGVLQPERRIPHSSRAASALRDHRSASSAPILACLLVSLTHPCTSVLWRPVHLKSVLAHICDKWLHAFESTSIQMKPLT